MTYACLSAVLVPTGWFVVGLIALLLMVAHMLAGIFGPMPRYQIDGTEDLPPNDSEPFLLLLESLTDAKLNRTGKYSVFHSGPDFYHAELETIRGAQQSINLEAYIFQNGNIGQQFVDAMAERARNGVRVNLVLDSFGSMGTTEQFLRPLTDAGGRVSWYNGPTWYRLLQMTNRTHRELLIVDGKTAYIGGAGIADHWFTGVKGNPRWRDTVLRVEGEAVPNLQATFAENWLASCGELLVGHAYFPEIQCPHRTVAMVVNSTPTIGGSTRARVLFQLLLASAKQSITITTPYFLPDKSLTSELCRAVKRGVRVRILVPGHKSDHFLTRSTSRGGYGPLLEAGAEIFEYQPAMIHAKILCIDDRWAVVGSTNFDNRSFGLNDEVNLAISDPEIARTLLQQTERDIAESKAVSLRDWKHRPVTQRAPEMLGWIFERQQ